MPLFDIACLKCSVIHSDVILKEYKDYVTLRKNPCNSCKGIRFYVLAPLCAMQPDNMWAGADTRFGHFTSKSQYNQLLKDRNIESVSEKELDSVKKKVYNAKQDKLNKLKTNVNEFVEKELASVEISPDGNTVKEKNKYARKRQ